ncbi:MAG: glutathione S-transferase [Rhodobacteraceae bacterium]|nr:glutathione S-transferase [Paracoccaceae bacterium]MBR9820466.1 glutathione S-transferase [Paracoccaceae bacterium]
MEILHDFSRGPYPARVRIALAELGLQYRVRFVEVDLRTGAHKTPAFRAKNYSGTLPVLELEDGTFLAECTAITEYLDHLGPQPRLTGLTARERGVIHMMNKRAEIEFLDPISVYFHHATPGLGPEVELYQNREWGLQMRDKALRGAAYFDHVLATRPHVAGEVFSMADITVVAGFIFARLLRLEIPAELHHLHAWHDRMRTRPSVRGWREMG